MLHLCGRDSRDCGHTEIHAIYTTNISCEYIDVYIRWYICEEHLHINYTTIFLGDFFTLTSHVFLKEENSHGGYHVIKL